MPSIDRYASFADDGGMSLEELIIEALRACGCESVKVKTGSDPSKLLFVYMVPGYDVEQLFMLDGHDVRNRFLYYSRNDIKAILERYYVDNECLRKEQCFVARSASAHEVESAIPYDIIIDIRQKSIGS